MQETPIASLAAPFTDGLRAGVLRYQHCSQCQGAQTLARYACQHCGGTDLQWREASGHATVRAATVVARAPSDDFRPLAPYTLVIAELDEGPRLMAHALPGTQIGQRVRASTFEHAGRTLVRFSPTA